MKRICNETKALDGYREDRKPAFRSLVSQFMTVIYSVEYELPGVENVVNGTLNGTLNEKQKGVLDFITASPGTQAQVITDQLVIPHDTLNKILKVLTDRDLIERRGSKKTGGYYVKQ